jgi:uncharacterized protein (TIGR02996 family)
MIELKRIGKGSPMPKKPDTAAGFIQAISAEPDDDTHRLVFADWLDDHGDPERAEFIRLQIDLDKMNWLEPGYDEKERRARGLEHQNRERWFAEPAVLQPYADRVRYQRGFPEEIKLTVEEFAEHGSVLLQTHPVHTLRVRGKFGKAEAAALAACPALAWLPGLRLGDDSRCNKDALTAILASPHLSRLTALGLPSCNVTLASLRTLLGSPVLANLRRLELRGNEQLGDRGAELLAGAPGLANLTHLNLTTTDLGDVGAHALAESENLGRLECLELGWDLGWGNRVTGAGVQALVTSPQLRSLKSLPLKNNPIGDEGAVALGGWPCLRYLTDLDLTNCGIGPKGAAALAASPHLGRLVDLDLGGNRIHKEGARALAGSERLEHLYRLDLGYNEIGDKGVTALARAKHLARLRQLVLCSNEIGDAGAAALASAAHLDQLEELRLYNNEIGDAGVIALAASPIWQYHSQLDRRENRIGDRGAAALAVCPHLAGLVALILNHNQIGADGMLALAGSPCLPQGLSVELLANAVEKKRLPEVRQAIRKRFKAPKVWV